MAKQTINLGTSANKGDGDPLRTAFDKVNDNFDELYARDINTDFSASVFGDDSTLLVDAVNNVIPSSVVSGTEATNWNTAYSWGDHSGAGYLTSVPAQTFASLTSTPTTIAGYGIADAYTKTEVDSAITSSVLPSGSTQSIDVVAQDSTVLVDSVNGTLNATTLTGALPAINGSALTNVTTTFANITSTPTTISGYGITDAYTKTEVDAQISAPTGDLTGSVFGDDSTLLVDGVNNKIVGAVETSSLRTSETSIKLGNGAGQSSGLYIVAIGYDAGTTDQGSQAVAVGSNAGRERQGVFATALGRYAGQMDQGANSVAIGSNTGQTTQGDGSVAIGNEAGKTTQSTLAVAVGQYAGYDTQGTAGVAIGNLAGRASQGVQAIAVGQNAGNTSQGTQSIAIGSEAGKTNQAANSIVINATGSEVNNTTASSLVVKPIRNAIGTTMLMYDATSGEVTYSGSIQESFSTTNAATGVTALDCSTGNVHYLTAPTGDITANFTNLNVTAEYATNVTVVIDQGGTEYEITAVQIGGVAQTIVWQGNSAPTGTANGVDSFSFTILNDGGTYVVLGQMVAFGGV